MSTKTDHPIIREGNTSRIKNVALASTDQPVELVIRDGVIVSITPVNGPAEWICFPPLADKHMHANRAFTITHDRPKNFDDCVRMTVDLLDQFKAEDYRRQASQLFERAYSHGTTFIRTHVDIDQVTGLEGIEGTVAARKACSDPEVEIVSFATGRLDPADDEARLLLKRSIESGADLLGATPVFYPQPDRSMESLIDLAIELDVEVDLHLDEHLEATNSWTEALADIALTKGFIGRVTLGHICALSVLDPSRRDRIISKLAEAQVTVISLPLTNLYLQDRNPGSPGKRGLTVIKELLAAGVKVLFATDNVRDAFYPFGDADLLDTAYSGMLASQVDDAKTLTGMICDGREEVQVGDRANLVLVKGSSFDEVLSQRPPERIVLKG